MLMVMFFLGVNVSLALINISQVLPQTSGMTAYTAPQDWTSIFFHVDLSTGNIYIGIALLSATAIFGWIVGRLLFGGIVALMLFVVDLLSPIVSWVFLGIPKFINNILATVPTDATTSAALGVIMFGITAFLAVVWFWFFLGIFVSRPLED